MLSTLKNRSSKLTFLPVLFVNLLISGCAADYARGDFEQRISGSETISGLIVEVTSTGIELGGLTHHQTPADYAAMWMTIRYTPKIFTKQQLQHMENPPTLYLPEELIGIGYKEDEVKRDTTLLAGLLKSAMNYPWGKANRDELEAVQRFASRCGADFVLLGHIHTSHHTSDKSRSYANLLTILMAAGGQ